MSSTTVTEFYELTQYIGTDKPSFTDNNEAFRKIDADLHEAVVGVEDQAEAIAAITSTVANLGSAVVTLQSDLNTEKGKIVNLQNKETLQDAEIADVKADAQNMITAYVEATATSTHAYSAGDFFIYNDVLYKATDSIAIGDTIVPDTNCTTDNVTTELLQIKSDLLHVQSFVKETSDVVAVNTDATIVPDLPATYNHIRAIIVTNINPTTNWENLAYLWGADSTTINFHTVGDVSAQAQKFIVLYYVIYD